MSSRVFCIAEAAGTHDGSLDKAFRLIDLAAEIGADAVKFQWLSSPESLVERRHAPEYLEAYRTIAFPEWWFEVLYQHCDNVGIELMCTCYLEEDINVIAYWVERFKCSSFENEDLSFLRAHVHHRKPIIISAGMNGRRGHVHGDAEIYWLHCISSYPAPIEDMNLRVLRHGEYDGLSDHSKHPQTGAWAVCAGAEIIEFHYRLHDTMPTNADYEVARTPEEAEEYVKNIREAEVALGDGVRRVQKSEESMLKYRVRA